MWSLKKESVLEKYNQASADSIKKFLTIRGIQEPLERLVVSPEGYEMDIPSSFKKDKRIYLTAEPGEGKSITLADFAKNVSNGKIDGMSTAFFIPLYRLSSSDFDCPDLIIELLYGNSPYNDVNKEFFTSRLHSTDTVVMLDGLDEIALPSQRTEFDIWLDSVRHVFPEPQYLMVSSRPWISLPRIEKDFSPYTFKPLSDQELMILLESESRALYSRNNRKKDWIEQQINEGIDFFQRTKKGIEGYEHILHNPGYIRLAALLDGMLPKYADEFLSKGINAYLLSAQFNANVIEDADKCPEGREIKYGQLITDATHLIKEMAFKLHESGRTSMSLDEVKSLDDWNCFKQYDMSHRRLSISEKEKEMVMYIIGETSNFLAVSHTDRNNLPHYYFTHLGIQEFLVGRQLADMMYNSDIGEVIGDKINQSWWRQPIIYSTTEFNFRKVLDLVKKTNDQKFMADAYLFAMGFSMDFELRRIYQNIYDRVYPNPR